MKQSNTVLITGHLYGTVLGCINVVLFTLSVCGKVNVSGYGIVIIIKENGLVLFYFMNNYFKLNLEWLLNIKTLF